MAEDEVRRVPMGEDYPDEEYVPVQVFGSVGRETGLALVELRIKDRTLQVSPDQARMIGYWLLEAADHAESDKLVIDWLQVTLKIDEDAAWLALGALVAMRRERDELKEMIRNGSAFEEDDPAEPSEPEIPEYGSHPGAVIREYDE